jgi:molecular chaperone GrpE
MEAQDGGGRLASDEVEDLRRTLREHEQQHVRLLADFENFRRRSAREREGTRAEERRDTVLRLLPALDALERALAAGSTDMAFYEGVAATHLLFLTALRELGVEPIESAGRRFDPNLHEAVATVAREGVEPGTVAHEVRRGWRLGNELLRAAQVVVAAAPEVPEP